MIGEVIIVADTVLAAALKVLADIILTGKPLLEVKHLKQRMNASFVMSGTTSRWAAQVTQQVYRQIHTFLVAGVNVS